ncbi:hypothetical protein Bca52824_019132 [Brassica carinata]|uniref:Uncharacterized protein n=1 Tax=Brassica carinata TaxID=52824 RepID=A0A8X7VRF1_BRACI|nr:hypothetical protein Bca52824_019132 [Brassica carinata]
MASKKARKQNRAEKKLKRTHFKKQVPQHKNTQKSTILEHTSSSSDYLIMFCDDDCSAAFTERLLVDVFMGTVWLCQLEKVINSLEKTARTASCKKESMKSV